MHKGYTLNYFINFFKNIPNSRWTTDALHEDGTVRFCALGHCLTHQNSDPTNVSEDDLATELDAHDNAKVDALEAFLEGNTADINDGVAPFSSLGATPRGRILRALRNRKRTGNVFGETD